MANRSSVRHKHGQSEFVVDLRHLPLVVTTWFGAPTLDLVDAYDHWLRRFVEASLLSGRRVVILDDASRAERPTPPVRGRLAKLECPDEVIVARVIVAPTPALRGATTALSWATGTPLRAVESIEAGIAEARNIFSARKIEPPRKFDLEPPLPTALR